MKETNNRLGIYYSPLNLFIASSYEQYKEMPLISDAQVYSSINGLQWNSALRYMPDADL